MIRNLISLSLVYVALSSPLHAASDVPKFASEDDIKLEAIGEGLKTQRAILEDKPDEAKVHFAKSITLYDQILKKNPDDLDTLVNRGLLKNTMEENSGKDDFEQAVTLATSQIQANPNKAELYSLRSTAYKALQKYSEAKKDLMQAITLKPDKRLWKTELRLLEAEEKFTSSHSKP